MLAPSAIRSPRLVLTEARSLPARSIRLSLERVIRFWREGRGGGGGGRKEEGGGREEGGGMEEKGG